MDGTGVKLNLGCGRNKLPGYINLDVMPKCRPDLVVDLERFPWPFADGCADEIVANHVLEHLGADKTVFFNIFKELYRVARPGAKLVIVVPDPRSDDYLSDPTHVRPITPALLELFSRRLNAEWARTCVSNTPLGLYLDVDFEINSVEVTLTEEWRSRLTSGDLGDAELTQAMQRYNNVVSQIKVELTAIK